MLNDLREAKVGGGVLAGAETEPGIEDYDGLSRSGFDFGPAGFDDECGTDTDWLEIFLPGFSPIFAADGSDLNFGLPSVEAELLQVGESGLDLRCVGSELRGCGANVGGNGGSICFRVGIDARGDCEDALEQRENRIFTFITGRDRDLGYAGSLHG